MDIEAVACVHNLQYRFSTGTYLLAVALCQFLVFAIFQPNYYLFPVSCLFIILCYLSLVIHKIFLLFRNFLSFTLHDIRCLFFHQPHSLNNIRTVMQQNSQFHLLLLPHPVPVGPHQLLYFCVSNKHILSVFSVCGMLSHGRRNRMSTSLEMRVRLKLKAKGLA